MCPCVPPSARGAAPQVTCPVQSHSLEPHFCSSFISALAAAVINSGRWCTPGSVRELAAGGGGGGRQHLCLPQSQCWTDAVLVCHGTVIGRARGLFVTAGRAWHCFGAKYSHCPMEQPGSLPRVSRPPAGPFTHRKTDHEISMNIISPFLHQLHHSSSQPLMILAVTTKRLFGFPLIRIFLSQAQMMAQLQQRPLTPLRLWAAPAWSSSSRAFAAAAFTIRKLPAPENCSPNYSVGAWRKPHK